MSDNTTIDIKADANDSIEVETVALSPAPEDTAKGRPLFDKIHPSIVENLQVKAHVALGQVNMSVGELFDLKEKSLVTLDTLTTAPLEMTIDGHLVALGRLVVQGDHFGLEITESQTRVIIMLKALLFSPLYLLLATVSVAGEPEASLEAPLSGFRQAPDISGGLLWKYLLLLAILGAIAAGLWWFRNRKMALFQSQFGESKCIQIVDSKKLSPDTQCWLLNVNDQTVLVTANSRSLTTDVLSTSETRHEQ